MKSLQTWKLIAKSLMQDIAVMLLYVLESSGSSPGRAGFLMAVNAAGEMEGSLGGGIMEHKFVEMAKANLLQHEHGSSVHKQIHNKNAVRDRSGMICSGEQTIMLYHAQGTDLVHIDSIIACLERFENGSLHLSPAGVAFSKTLPDENNPVFTMVTKEDWKYVEKVGYQNHLFIIGAGHCALALSRIMSMMDFYIHLFDDRPGLKTMMENTYAHEKQVLNNYSVLSERIDSGKNNYVVIMTVGYRTDTIALESVIKKKFQYLGLLGSKSKIEQMFADLRKQGIAEKDITRLHAPIGLPVNSHTPEEVAISIAAEIIKVKNEKISKLAN